MKTYNGDMEGRRMARINRHGVKRPARRFALHPEQEDEFILVSRKSCYRAKQPIVCGKVAMMKW